VPVESTGDSAADTGQVLAADFVVDAMGRSSRLSEWLEQAGWPRPALRRMNVDLNYATAVFRRGDELPTVNSAVSFQTPQSTFSRTTAAMVSVEGGRRMIVLAGYADNRPSRDPEEFRRACGEQPREFAEIAERCEMIGPVLTYRQADSRRRDFHRLDRLPGGLVAAGDAVSSFNPVYGQGMTSGALHASCLSEYLRSGASPTAPAHRYFDDVRVVVDAAWQTSTLADLGLPHVTGPYPRGYRIMTWLSGLVANASLTDADINHRLTQVTNMLVHPNALATPGVLLRSVRALRGQARNGSAATAAD
jgi:2-polyprenyl-6-methoxyphenol hydroxylase-like FAD-dependent oxidoreductase